MISVRGRCAATVTYALMKGQVSVLMSVKIEFKDNRMRISASWLGANWLNNKDIDTDTFLTYGGLRCFNNKGEINNKKRYQIYSKMSSDFIKCIIADRANIDDW